MALPPNPRVKLSVVVVGWTDTQLLERCLASLKVQAQAHDTEVIVVSNDNGASQEMIRKDFPDIEYMGLPEDTTVPELRARGIAHSGGEIIALIEDHCSVSENWCAEMKRGHELSYPVIGGPIEKGRSQRRLDWAVYFYDYGRYMPPHPRGVVDSLTGNNVGYKRSSLEEIATIFRDGFFEDEVHREFRKRGHDLFMQPDAIVHFNRTHRLAAALRECYHHGRSFAGRRVFGVSGWRRAGWVLGSAILPVLLPLRIIMTVLRKKRHVRELLTCLPYLLALMSIWSLGEFMGYAFGEGESRRNWK